MSSSIGVPLDRGPMDVENSTPVPTHNNNSSSTISTMDTDSANAQPEVAAAGGGTAGGSSSSNLPLPPGVGMGVGGAVSGVVAANAVVAGDAPEEKAEPSIPEVALVPVPPNFDLDAYISRYGGYTKLRRLDWVAQRCPDLAPDCYRAALTLLRQGINTQSYRDISARAVQLMGPEYAEDTEWADQVDRRYQQSVDKLEAELNSYKTNLIKESIRMGYNELGDLSYRRGDLKQALKCYARTRDYCTTNRHSAEMCLHVIEVSADMRNFIHVNNYVLKAEHTPDLDTVVAAKLRAAAGLVHLDQGEYAKAARKFVDVSPELGSSFDGVVAPEDIAVYGGLCALATFSRSEMKRRVLENTSFKNFLDLVPQVRELTNDFANSRYKMCLQYLANLKGELQLDLHLHRHLDVLYKMVEDKCLMQYFSPYTSVRLGAMSEAFGVEVSEVEKKVADLIIANQISARIDSTNATLHAKHTEQRSISCQKMHELGEQYQRELRSMLVRMSCIEHDFIVRGRGVASLSAGLLEDPSFLGASGGGRRGLELTTGSGLFGSLGGGGGGGRGGGGRDDDEAAGVAAAVAAVEAATAAEREASVAAAAAAAGGGGGGDGSSAATAAGAGTRGDEEGAGGAEPERPPEAGGGSSSKASGAHDAMDTVS
ncbi:unnamed protein product [Pylaiella littoralis]